MSFDPDAYLRESDAAATVATADAFDPDAYLATQPDAVSAAGQSQPVESPAGAPEAGAGLGVPAGNPAVLEGVSGAIAAGAGMPSWLARPLLTEGGTVGDVAAEIVPAVAGAVMGAPGGLPGIAAGGAAGAAVGNLLKQTREIVRGEREDIGPGELAVSTATGAVPFPAAKGGATLLKTVGRAAGTRAAQGALIAGGGEVARQVIDEGELAPGRVLEAAATGAALSTVLGGVEGAVVAKRSGQLGKAMTELRLKVAPQSVLPDAVRQELRWGEQASGAVTQQGLRITRDLERAIKDEADPEKLAPLVKGFLEGNVPAGTLPAKIEAAAQRVRTYVDDLSARAVSEGVVTGELADNFLKNRGSYLRRSYGIFVDPDYQPDPKLVQQAIDAVASADGIDRAAAEGVVAGILDRNSRNGLADFMLGRGKIAGKDVSSLVKREDLLPEIRALLGEVQDPVLAANQTIPRLARLIEHDAAQKSVREIGLRTGLFREAQSLSHPTPLVAESSRPHDVLAGLYTQPEISAALQKEAAIGRSAFVPDLLWRGLTTASSVAKMGKTVLNPESYAPNFLGGVLMNLANGNFRYQASRRALALGAEELGTLRQFMPTLKGRGDLQVELTKLQRLGVLGESVNTGDLLRTVKSSFLDKLGDKTKTFLSLPSKLYGGVDEFNRYVAFQSERARYAKALPGLTPDDLDRRAAETVRATFPTYSEVPKAVKQLSVAGFAPSFVNFTWEVFRNTKNSVAVALRDIAEGQKAGNAELVKAGAARMAAVMATVGAASMMGVSKLSRDTHKVDDAKDEAVRYFAPPWSRNGVLLYMSGAEPGKPVKYANLSYLIPHATLWQAVDAGRRGLDDGQAVAQFFGALNEQFGFGNSVLIPPLAAAIQGFDPETGREIPKTAITPTLSDRAKYLGEKAFMPLAVSQAEKWRMAFAGEQGDFGRIYTPEEQIKRLMAVRAQTLDPAAAVQWKAKDVAANLQNAGELYRLRGNRGKTEADRHAAYARAEEARKIVWADLQAMVRNARVLGVPEDKVVGALRAARVPAPVILGVLDGRYVPLAENKPKTMSELYAEWRGRPIAQRRADLLKFYQKDPAVVRAFIQRAKDEQKGLTERDRLVLSLGVTDGERAKYLAEQFGAISEDSERKLWLIAQRRKGLLTDKVLEQMTKARRRPSDGGAQE